VRQTLVLEWKKFLYLEKQDQYSAQGKVYQYFVRKQNKFSNKFRFQIQAEVFFSRNVFNFEKISIVCNKQEMSKSLLKRNLKWK